MEAFYDVPHPDVFVLGPPEQGIGSSPVLKVDSSIVLKDEPAPQEGFVYAGSIADGAGYWIPKDPMDVALSDFGLEPLSDDVYLVFGGMDGQGKVVDAVFHGQDVVQKYQPRAKMPEPRYRHAHARLGDRLYVIGGLSDPAGAPKAEVLVYSVKDDAWVSFEPQLNVPRTDACAVAIGDSIFVVGGYDEVYNTL